LEKQHPQSSQERGLEELIFEQIRKMAAAIMRNELTETTVATAAKRFGGSTKFDTWSGGGGRPGICPRMAVGSFSTMCTVDALIDDISGIEKSNSFRRDEGKNVNLEIEY
jgi:hypothetical protein